MSDVVRLRRRAQNPRFEREAVLPSPFPDLRTVVLADLPLPIRAPRGGSMPAHEPVPASVAGVVDEQAAQAIAEEAFARGVEEGTRQAESAYAVELKRRLIEEREQATSSAAGRLERIGDKLQAQIGDVQVRAEEAVVRLALSIAEQVVKREVRMNNTLVIQQIREALHRVVGVEHIKIRVNPADEAVVREHRTAVLSGSDAVRELVIEPDPKIEAGGCILESDSGNVDARLSTQLKKIESMFLEQNVVS